MHALRRWNQLRELEALHRGRSSLFSRPSSPGPEGEEKALAMAEWVPLVDISEDDSEYLILAELPDVQKEDITVTVTDGTLTIMGERTLSRDHPGRKYHRLERAYGSFGRSFSLPANVSQAGVTAGVKDGVLTVHLPKTAQVGPRQIHVNVA